MSERDKMHNLEDKQDCANASFELNGNRLPKLASREQEVTQDDVYFSDASGFSAAGSNGLVLSPEDEANELHDICDTGVSSAVLASENNTSNEDARLPAKTYLQSKDEGSIMDMSTEERKLKGDKFEEQYSEDALCFEEYMSNEDKKLEIFAENVGGDVHKDDIRGVLEPGDSGIENIPIESVQSNKKRNCLDDTLNDGEEGYQSRNSATENILYSESEPVISNNHNIDDIPDSEENESFGNREFCKKAKEKVSEVHYEEINDNIAEFKRRRNSSSCDGNFKKSSFDSDLDIVNDSTNFDPTVKDDIDEEESEYLSVASHRYSSVESLDDPFSKQTNRPGKDLLLGSEIDCDGGAKSIHGSEADRTDDDYLTCDEHSTVGLDGQTCDDHDDDDEQQICLNNHEVVVTGSFVNDNRRHRSFEGYDDDDDDYEGYETLDYLTADEQSEFDGGANNITYIEEERNVLETRMKQTDSNDSSVESLVNVKEGGTSQATDGEEYATADEDRKEDEDDRSTVVGSDDEEKECHRQASDKTEIIDTDTPKPTEAEALNESKDRSSIQNEMAYNKKEDHEIIERGNGIKEEEDKSDFGIDEGENKSIKQKTSFFSSMMAKKEAKIAEKLFSYNQRYEIALEGIAQANARFKKAKSDLPLMIIEKRIPKVEELQRKSDKLEGLKTRLESYIEYNKSINDYIQNWRTSEGSVHDRKAEFQRCSNKTSERQKMLMACKKRQSFLHSELLRQDDVQLHKKRRIQRLTERLDMLNLRQTEQRNLVKRRIDEAKKYCELSVREAAKVVVASKRLETLKKKEKELEDKLFNGKKELKKARQKRKEKEFEVERANIQKSVKAMKKERGW